MTLSGKNIILNIQPSLISDNNGNVTLHLSWNDNNSEHKQDIEILKDVHAYIGGRMAEYYFFKTGELKCRNMYYHEGAFKNQHDFPSMNKCRTNNRMKAKMERIRRGNPERKGGHRFCKGELTPYGKRCVRYEIARLEMLKHLYGEITQMQEKNLDELKVLIKSIEGKKKAKNDKYMKKKA